MAVGTRSWLALVCYRQLDLGCGDGYQKGLPEDESEDRLSNESIDEARAHALAAKRLQKRGDMKSRIALVGHYSALSRYSDARKVADELVRKHPRDARAVVAKASVLLDQDFDTRAASELLEAADGFDNREDKFFQMRIGLVFEYLKPLIARPDASQKELAATLESLAPIIRDYAQINFDRGKMLELGIKLGRTMLDIQLRKASPADFARTIKEVAEALVALRKEPAAGLHLRRLQLMLARLDADGDRALASVGPEAGYDEVEGLHAQVRAYLALARNEIDAGLADLQGPKSFEAREARAALMAAQAARDNDRQAWQTVLDALSGMRLSSEEPEDTQRLMNNQAVAMYHLGLRKAAANLLDELSKNQDVLPEAKFNLEVMKGEFTEESDPEANGFKLRKAHRKLWRKRLKSKRTFTRKRLRAALVKEVPNSDMFLDVRGAYGVVLSNEFSVGLGYSTTKGLQLEVNIATVPVYLITAAAR